MNYREYIASKNGMIFDVSPFSTQLDPLEKGMRQDGLCWLTLTLGSATYATDLIEVEEQIRVAQASDGQWLVTEYPTMLVTVKAKTLPLAILEYLKKRLEP